MNDSEYITDGLRARLEVDGSITIIDIDEESYATLEPDEVRDLCNWFKKKEFI